MPCNSRISQSVSEGALNLDVLGAAGKALGYSVSIERGVLAIEPKAYSGWNASYQNGRLQVQSWGDVKAADKLAELRRGYAAQAVRVAAKRCGWNVSSSVASPNKLRMTRG
jgi:hypothetical protein